METIFRTAVERYKQDPSIKNTQLVLDLCLKMDGKLTIQPYDELLSMEESNGRVFFIWEDNKGELFNFETSESITVTTFVGELEKQMV
jgi:hypothetical protein